MKKHFKNSSKLLFVVTLLTSIVYISSCSKDSASEIKYAEENFLKDYLKNAGFNEASSVVNQIGLKEYFLDFSPSVNGKINSLVIKAPENQTQIEVSIIDVTNDTYLKTLQVDCIAGKELIKNIEPIALKKGNLYKMVVDYTANYEYRKADNSQAKYPVKAGNVDIIRFGVRHIRSTIEYLEIAKKYYAGEFSFNFQRTE